MARLYANNYTSTINSAITDVATTIVVTNATGLPTITGSDYYNLTLSAGGVVEIVKVTARTGTSLTVVRAQESTSAVAWAAGSIISLRATASSFSGVVSAPSSTTDNAIARFDGTAGAIQNSTVTVSDTGTIAGIESITVGTTTVATNDKVLINDTSASDVTKTVTTQAIANLAKAASTTDNAAARYDGTTGDFQNSLLIIADTTGNISGFEQATASKNLVVGGNSTAAGYIDLLEDSDNGSNKVTITAPASIASDKTITFPDSTGTVVLTSTSKPVIQRVYTQTGASATGTTIMPADDTIPQNTEGTEFMTLAITPTNASNILEIRVQAYIYNSSASPAGDLGALFQDTTANALAAMDAFTGLGSVNLLTITHTMVAGTTSSTTFKFRAGPQSAATVTFNGAGGARLLGGVFNSYIIITEYQV